MRSRVFFLLFSIIYMLVSSGVLADIPNHINYQGRLTDNLDAPVDNGSYQMTFKIYGSESGSDVLWNSGSVSVLVINGLFNVQLGSSPMPSLPDDLFSTSTIRYLGITIGSDPELVPRTPMTSGAYAFHALRADTAMYAQNVVGGGNGWTDDGGSIRLTDTNDSVGIGTSSPSTKLDVNGDVFFYGKATIGSGHNNTGSHAVVLGGTSNTASADIAVVCGGDANTAQADAAVVSGGQGNTASGLGSTVGGGAGNTSYGFLSSIAGGGMNDVGDPATGNRAVSDYSFIGGGGDNQAGDDMSTPDSTAYATVSGGESNSAMGKHSFVGGGQSNLSSGQGAVISGGKENQALSVWTFIGGGHTNLASDSFAVVSGGVGNQATGGYSTTAGGIGNQASGNRATVAGGDSNDAEGYGSVVCGGFSNNADGTATFIGGGSSNTAIGTDATVSGGSSNYADGNNSIIGGGWDNHAESDYSTVGGGQSNYARDAYCFVGGGRNNSAGYPDGDPNSAYYSTVGGGFQNHAYGRYSTVPGGDNCTAIGQFSFAAGKMAKAKHDGSFVWADNTTENFESDTTNQFKIRAENGMTVYSVANDWDNGVSIFNDGYGNGLDVYSHAADNGKALGGISINNFGSASALHAWQLHPDSGYAGEFLGDVRIEGEITKTRSITKIDHPLDPENMYLYHSSVESSEMMNVYSGNVILDGNGGAWVVLPDWFEALNKEYRYQLTCIGGHANVYIDQEIENNRFKIAGGHAGLKVSWQVTGIRQDAYAEANKLLVEEYKKPDLRGKYLHPKAFGLSEEQGVHYEALQKRLEQISMRGYDR
jgi:hypothetical protein